jgi:hypothetical protein
MAADYSQEYALAMAQQRAARVPEHANAALVELLFIARMQALAPEAHAALNRAIQHLEMAVTAPDALRVEQEAAQCL